MNFIRQKRAYTLIEVLVSIAIFSFILMALYQMFAVGNRSWANYNEKVALQREIRWSMYAVVKELREAKNIFVTDDSEKVKIAFKKDNLGSFAFVFMKTGQQRNKLFFERPNQKRVLSSSVTNLKVDQISKHLIEIEITGMKQPLFSKLITFKLKQRILLRN